MKKCLSLLLMICLALSLFACAKEEKPEVTTLPDAFTESSESAPSEESTEPTEPAQPSLSELTDRELIVRMIKSRKLETPSISSVYHTDGYWLLWLVQNCDPLRELLSRESGLKSLETMGLEVAAELSDNRYLILSCHIMESWLMPMLFPDLFIQPPDDSILKVGDICTEYSVKVYGTKDAAYTGKTWTLTDSANKIRVISFWFCYEAGGLNNLQNVFPVLCESYGDEVEVIAVHSNQEYSRDITEYINANLSTSCGILYTKDVANEGFFNALTGGQPSWPVTIVVDETGVIRYKRVGVVTIQEMCDTIDDLLAN